MWTFFMEHSALLKCVIEYKTYYETECSMVILLEHVLCPQLTDKTK